MSKIGRTPTFKVVYNNRYGGFGMAKNGLDEYNRRTSQNLTYADVIDRSDPILIEIVQTMGKNVNDEHSRLAIKEFPMKYKSFLKWSDYDGNESVDIDYDKYLIHHIREIKDEIISSYEKIVRIDQLYEEYDARPTSYLDE
jgi:hypothetical protein